MTISIAVLEVRRAPNLLSPQGVPRRRKGAHCGVRTHKPGASRNNAGGASLGLDAIRDRAKGLLVAINFITLQALVVVEFRAEVESV